MGLKIRFLLTSKCTATCGYCHNEGQSEADNLLSLDNIRQVLQTLHANVCQSEEIVLSGGEPTLHKQLGDIPRLCRAAAPMWRWTPTPAIRLCSPPHCRTLMS